MDIDSIGSCVKNKMYPLRLKSLEYDEKGNNKREKWGNYEDATHALLKTYKFRLLIISALCENYFAEKVYQTLLAGTIPIYLGIPNSHDWDVGIAAGVHPAMIHVQDYKSIKELAEYVNELSADTEDARQARLKFFEYQRTPPSVFPRHRPSIVNGTGGYAWREFFLCGTTHHGDPTRKIGPQPQCEGAWYEYLNKTGHDLEKWDIELARKYQPLPWPVKHAPTHASNQAPMPRRNDWGLFFMIIGYANGILTVCLLIFVQRYCLKVSRVSRCCCVDSCLNLACKCRGQGYGSQSLLGVV